MPALQNAILTDRTPVTPVNHTFTPRSLVDGVATIVKADASGLPISEMRYTIASRRNNGRIKTTVKFAVPIVQTEVINSVSRPVVVRESYIDCTFNFPDTSTELERNNAVGMFASSLSTGIVLVHDTIVKAQGVYGA